MAFHCEWHATQQGRGRQYWEAAPEPSLDQLARVIAALEAVQPVSARPEFVADLRARLLRSHREHSLDPLSGPGPSEAPSRRLGPERLAPPFAMSRPTIDQPP